MSNHRRQQNGDWRKHKARECYNRVLWVRIMRGPLYQIYAFESKDQPITTSHCYPSRRVPISGHGREPRTVPHEEWSQNESYIILQNTQHQSWCALTVCTLVLTSRLQPRKGCCCLALTFFLRMGFDCPPNPCCFLS